MLAHDARTGDEEAQQQEDEPASTTRPSLRGASAEHRVVDADERIHSLGYYQRADGRRHDLDPIPPEERTWTACSYISLWVSMTVSVPSFILVTSLLQSGLSYGEACLAVLIGSALVAPALVLNGRAGARYGISFPVLARASFGIRGSQLPTISRALVACGWYGINAWIGGGMLHDLTRLWAPPAYARWEGGETFMFFIFGAVNVAVVIWGMEGIRRVLVVQGALLVLIALLMLAWAIVVIVTRMDGRVDLSAVPPHPTGASTITTPLARWGNGITSVAGSWATLALNIPDFARFAKDEKSQILGQALGLPLSLFSFSVVCALVSAAAASYDPSGRISLNPLDILADRTEGRPALHALCLLALASSAMAANVAANVVGPAMDFANMLPQYLSFRKGALLTGLVAIAFCPWRLLRSGRSYTTEWLVAYAALLGPVLGVMLAHYYVISHQALNIPGLYARPPADPAVYWYTGGFNPRAVAALVIGVLPTLPGMGAALAAGGPSEKGASVWSVLYSFSWFIGLGVAALAYVALMYMAEMAEKGKRRRAGAGKEDSNEAVVIE